MMQGVSALPTLVSALVVRADAKLVAALDGARAHSEATAIPLSPTSRVARSRLAKLEAVGAVRQQPAGRFYLHQASWAAFRRRRRFRALSIVAVGVAAVAAMTWLG